MREDEGSVVFEAIKLSRCPAVRTQRSALSTDSSPLLPGKEIYVFFILFILAILRQFSMLLQVTDKLCINWILFWLLRNNPMRKSVGS